LIIRSSLCCVEGVIDVDKLTVIQRWHGCAGTTKSSGSNMTRVVPLCQGVFDLSIEPYRVRSGVARPLSPRGRYLTQNMGSPDRIQSWKIRYNAATHLGTWVERRNQQSKPADWRLTTGDARIKLKRLYPILSNSLTTRNLPRW
jgi:hypothetical protein